MTARAIVKTKASERENVDRLGFEGKEEGAGIISEDDVAVECAG